MSLDDFLRLLSDKLLVHIKQLVAGFRVREARLPIVTLDVLLKAIVSAGLIEMIKGTEALLHIAGMVGQELIEAVEFILLAIFSDLLGTMLGGRAQSPA